MQAGEPVLCYFDNDENEQKGFWEQLRCDVGEAWRQMFGEDEESDNLADRKKRSTNWSQVVATKKYASCTTAFGVILPVLFACESNFCILLIVSNQTAPLISKPLMCVSC